MLKRVIQIVVISLMTCSISKAQLSTDSTKIIINRNKKVLQIYSSDSLVKTYKVAVGKKKTPTPVGEFKIVTKVVNPTWFPKGKEPIEPGQKNPVGTRWMGLDIKGYGIHGTNEPNSIGKPASHGCIRMSKKDIEEIFQIVSIGTSVRIMDDVPNEEEKQFAKLNTDIGTVTLPLQIEPISSHN